MICASLALLQIMFAVHPRERWWRQPPKRDCISSPAGRLYGFIQTGAFYNLEAPYNNPRARGASNFSPLRTFGPADRQPSSTKGSCSYGASHQRGNAFPTPAGRLYGFPTGDCPVVKVLYKLAPSINLEAPSTTLSGIAAVKLKNPRGHSPVKL